MKIPVLPAVALLSLLALHSAGGAAVGSPEVSVPPGFPSLTPFTYFIPSAIYLLLLDEWLSFLGTVTG